MQKSEHIVRYSAEELEERRRRGETKSNWSKVDAISEKELEELIASDPDEAGLEWGPPRAGTQEDLVPQKKQVTVRLDRDVLDWFKSRGKGYQTRMNAVLRHYMEHEKKAG